MKESSGASSGCSRIDLEASNTAFSSLWSDVNDSVEDFSKIDDLGSLSQLQSLLESSLLSALWKHKLDLLVSSTASLVAVISVVEVTGQVVVSDGGAVLLDSPVTFICWKGCAPVVYNLWVNWCWLLRKLRNLFTTSAAVVLWVVELRGGELVVLFWNGSISAVSLCEDRARDAALVGSPAWSVVTLSLLSFPSAVLVSSALILSVLNEARENSCSVFEVLIDGWNALDGVGLVGRAHSWVEHTVGLDAVWSIFGWAWSESISIVIGAFIPNTLILTSARTLLELSAALHGPLVGVELESVRTDASLDGWSNWWVVPRAFVVGKAELFSFAVLALQDG